jgi:acetyltransferase-like isoleucine patch superfamily enzyme
MANDVQDAPPAGDAFAARLRRMWSRDRHLGLPRRLRKGVRFLSQLIRARIALRRCNSVGANPRVAGRIRVENHGFIGIGDRVNVNSSWVPTEFVTGGAGRIEIGDDVLINFGTVIAAGNRVRIGSGSMIGPHCIISDLDIPESAVRPEAAMARPVEIGKDVWLAGRVTLRPGVRIGDGAVVVAGSIVESDVPAGVMACGIPARLLPMLSGLPRSAVNAPAAPPASEAVRPASAAPEQSSTRSAPQLVGTLISDFRLDDLADELRLVAALPSVAAELASWADYPKTLGARPRRHAVDFAVVWTTPVAAVPALARLLQGERVDDRALSEDAERFCASVAAAAANYRYVFVPTWSIAAPQRHHPLADARPGGALYAISTLNLLLMNRLARLGNVFVMDTGRWRTAAGSAANAPRAWYLGRMAMPRAVVAEAALDIHAALAALHGIQRSLVVLVAHDTLWAGATDGAMATTETREAYADFQRALRWLTDRGVRLAVAGEGDETAVRRALRDSAELVLREDDFAAWSMNADGTAANVAALGARLGIPLRQIVYLDSRPAVQARVRIELPEVCVPDWPQSVLLYPAALQGVRGFEVAPSASPRDSAA